MLNRGDETVKRSQDIHDQIDLEAADASNVMVSRSQELRIKHK